MRIILKSLLPFLFLFSLSLSAQESTSDILGKAYKKAKTENKNVFVIFHASWCGWCKKMDQHMNSDDCKELFERNYVIEHLVVHESKESRHLENPGSFELLLKYKGDKSGIPFFLIFDKNGKLLEDSFDENGQNLGCPATKKEVEVFIKKLKATSDLNDDELSTIYQTFKIRD